MIDLTGSFFGLVGLLVFGVLILQVFALVDASIRRSDLYEAAGKLKKPFWLIILGIALVWDLLTLSTIDGRSLANFITIAGLVAALVYIVDVRPAIRSLGKGGKRGDGQHMGPYGPW